MFSEQVTQLLFLPAKFVNLLLHLSVRTLQTIKILLDFIPFFLFLHATFERGASVLFAPPLLPRVAVGGAAVALAGMSFLWLGGGGIRGAR